MTHWVESFVREELMSTTVILWLLCSVFVFLFAPTMVSFRWAIIALSIGWVLGFNHGDQR